MNAIHVRANVSLADFLAQCDPFGKRGHVLSLACFCVFSPVARKWEGI